MAKFETGIRVKVQPKASRSQVLGFHGDVLQVKVSGPPERGKANDALVELLAETLGVSRSRIRIVRGQTSRNKWIVVDDLSQDDLRHRVTGE